MNTLRRVYWLGAVGIFLFCSNGLYGQSAATDSTGPCSALLAEFLSLEDSAPQPYTPGASNNAGVIREQGFDEYLRQVGGPDKTLREARMILAKNQKILAFVEAGQPVRVFTHTEPDTNPNKTVTVVNPSEALAWQDSLLEVKISLVECWRSQPHHSNGGPQSVSGATGSEHSGGRNSNTGGQQIGTRNVSPNNSPSTGGCLPGDGPAGGCNTTAQASSASGNASIPRNGLTGSTAETIGSASGGTSSPAGDGPVGSLSSNTSSPDDQGIPADGTSPVTAGDVAVEPALSSANDSWSDPLSNVASNGGLANDDSRAYPVPTQEEIANTLNSGISNAEEASPTPVATVADADNWDQFSSSATPSSAYTSGFSSAKGPDTNAPVPDATDEQIDRDLQIVNADREGLSNILSSNEASDKIMDQGSEVVGSVAHQMNHAINDAEGSVIFSITSTENGASVGQINSDFEGFAPAMTSAALNDALPGYKYLNAINQDATSVQNYVTKKIQSVSCLFSFDPYCRK